MKDYSKSNVSNNIAEEFTDTEKLNLINWLLELDNSQAHKINSWITIKGEPCRIVSNNYCQCNIFFQTEKNKSGDDVCYSCLLPKLNDRNTFWKHIKWLFRSVKWSFKVYTNSWSNHINTK